MRPTVGRGSDYDPARELQLFNEFVRLSAPHLDRTRMMNDWDWLFVAQHHGLPTRLLDWTTNPLVATYFACQPSPMGKRVGEIIAVRVSDVGLLSHADQMAGPFSVLDAKFVYPTALADRIWSQRGIFSVHPSPNQAWRLRNKTSKITVAAEDKASFLGWLFGLGVDQAMIKADLDGLAENLAWRFRTGRAL